MGGTTLASAGLEAFLKAEGERSFESKFRLPPVFLLLGVPILSIGLSMGKVNFRGSFVGVEGMLA
jgi:hypothetical protein